MTHRSANLLLFNQMLKLKANSVSSNNCYGTLRQKKVLQVLFDILNFFLKNVSPELPPGHPQPGLWQVSSVLGKHDVALHDLLPQVHLTPRVEEQHLLLLHVGCLLHQHADTERVYAGKLLVSSLHVKIKMVTLSKIAVFRFRFTFKTRGGPGERIPSSACYHAWPYHLILYTRPFRATTSVCNKLDDSNKPVKRLFKRYSDKL